MLLAQVLRARRGALSPRAAAATRAPQLRLFSARAPAPAPGSSADLMARERRVGSENYHPLPVVLARGRGVSVWDVEGREYQDWLAGYSAVNQGHAHPRIVRTLQAQAERLTLVSRAFFSDQFAPYAELLTRTLGYERVLPMNTGAETGETALKLARRWAYDVKGVAPEQALMIYPSGNFWGRTLAAVSASSDPESYSGFGPLLPGYLSGESSALPPPPPCRRRRRRRRCR